LTAEESLMPKLATIALFAVLAISAFAQKSPKPPKNVKPTTNARPATMVYVDDAKRVYYKNAFCKAAAGLPAMRLSDARLRGYKAGRCMK
jgi:hypothetical protein